MIIDKLSLEEGKFLVRLARKTVEDYFTTYSEIKPPEDTPPILYEKMGVFVTLEKIVVQRDGMRRRVLRGCIGYPEPVLPLVEATIRAALDAAFHDPRFPPLMENELSDVIFEVSVLTKPELLDVSDPKEIPQKIKVGVHGLIIERGFFRGLLLPQVAVEYEWSEEEFLDQACIKAGLPARAWMLPGTKVYTFKAQIFAELEPSGEIIERRLSLSPE